MNAKATARTVEITADGDGLVSHAGAYLLTELADRIGLTAALQEAMASTRERRSVHDPGAVLRDLAISIADGGDCVSDLGVLREQETLFGPVASERTAHRVIKSIDAELLERIRSARATARERAWDAGARPTELVLDVDATLLASHSEKEQAAGNYKGGFGYHPLCCYLDATGEPLAAILRPGNAGANTARDRFEVLQQALEQLPPRISTARSSSARTPAATPTPSPPTAGPQASASRSATRSTSACARRSQACPSPLGKMRSTLQASAARAPRWPSSPTVSTSAIGSRERGRSSGRA